MMLLVATALALVAPALGARHLPASGSSLNLDALVRGFQIGPPCCTTGPTPPPIAPTAASPFLPPCCTKQGSIDLLPPCCAIHEPEVGEQLHPHKEKHAKRRPHPMGNPVAPAPTRHLEGGAVAEVESEGVTKIACCTSAPQPIAVASASRNRIDIIASFAILAFVMLTFAVRKRTVRVTRKPLPRELWPTTLVTESSIKRLRAIEPCYHEQIDA